MIHRVGGVGNEVRAGVRHERAPIPSNGRPVEDPITPLRGTARLEPLSTGEDCVITSDVRLDPEVLELLADPTSGLAAEPSEAMLKGFDNECFELWRVKRNRER